MMAVPLVLITAATTAATPPFGHALLDEFLWPRNITQFNHGSYGGVPKKVLQAQFDHVKEFEFDVQARIDSAWYRDRLVAIRKRVAEYINAPWEDTVIIDNASNAINVLLSTWVFKPNEVLLDFSTAYGPFKAYYEWLHATRGVETVTVPLKFPLDGPQPVVDALKETLAKLKMQGKSASVCVVSQVSSAPAVLLPVAEIVAILKAEGIASIVDGAHALGATPVDIAKLGKPDFWFGNGHKWLFTPRSTCALYVSKAYQTRYYPEPTVVDTFGDDFANRFVWSGTRDRSAFLAINDAFDFRNSFGEAALTKYVLDLSRIGADLLVREWGTGMLAPHTMQATMHNVIVPTNASAVDCPRVQSGLNARGVQIFAPQVDGLCYLRVHAEIYLELSDYARLAKMVKQILGLA